jgi:hypothetical protein
MAERTSLRYTLHRGQAVGMAEAISRATACSRGAAPEASAPARAHVRVSGAGRTAAGGGTEAGARAPAGASSKASEREARSAAARDRALAGWTPHDSARAAVPGDSRRDRDHAEVRVPRRALRGDEQSSPLPRRGAGSQAALARDARSEDQHRKAAQPDLGAASRICLRGAVPRHGARYADAGSQRAAVRAGERTQARGGARPQAPGAVGRSVLVGASVRRVATARAARAGRGHLACDVAASRGMAALRPARCPRDPDEGTTRMNRSAEAASRGGHGRAAARSSSQRSSSGSSASR